MTSGDAQTPHTFFQAYGADVDQMVFTRMILDDDTLVISGNVTNTQISNQSGMLIAKIDTSGNLIWSKVHYPKNGLNYSKTSNKKGLVKAPDSSGYYALGHIYEHSTGVLIKYDNNGNFLWQKEYPDGNSLQDYYDEIFVLENGLFILGKKQLSNYLFSVFLMKVDFQGNQLWQRYYDSGDRNRGFNSFLRLNDNEFVIGTITSPPSWNGNQPDDTFSTIISGIDKDGNVLWEWEGALSQDEGGAGALYHDYEGNWKYKSGRIRIFEDGTAVVQPSFVKRDAEFNLISTTYYDTLDYARNGFYDMIHLQSGGFLAVGHNKEDTTGLLFDTYRFGWMMRLDADGNTLWERLDLTPIDTLATANHWTTAVELESGSIIAVGTATTNAGFFEFRDWGSLIKVDKNGCIEMSCAITGLFEPEIFHKEVSIYPNPFHDQINIDTRGKYQVVIYNIYGQRIFYQAEVKDFTSLNLPKLLPGSYFVQLIFEDGQQVVKVVKG